MADQKIDDIETKLNSILTQISGTCHTYIQVKQAIPNTGDLSHTNFGIDRLLRVDYMKRTPDDSPKKCVNILSPYKMIAEHCRPKRCTPEEWDSYQVLLRFLRQTDDDIAKYEALRKKLPDPSKYLMIKMPIRFEELTIGQTAIDAAHIQCAKYCKKLKAEKAKLEAERRTRSSI
jgi:hypothetical protein